MNARLPPHAEHRRNQNMWVDEEIWGHRFHNEQTPWLVLLEFLAVFLDRDREERAFEEERPAGKHETFSYRVPRQSALRTLVFNNPHLALIEGGGGSDNERWERWLKDMGREDGARSPYAYVRDRFPDFSDFVRVVGFLRDTSVEPQRLRRWSSRFLFPYGPDCVYPDLREVKGRLENPDRLFFARGGELLYLMLNRSEGGAGLASLVRGRLLNPDNTWNRLARRLMPPDDGPDAVNMRIPGYLPIESLPDYDGLAGDWRRILGLALPGATLLDPLMRITGLHLVLYHLRRSLETAGAGGSPSFVLEIAAPKKTALFELSKSSHGENARLARRAVEAHLDRHWKQAGWDGSTGEETVRRGLEERFGWKPDRNARASKGRALFLDLRTEAVERNSVHVAKVAAAWSRSIGLSNARRRAGTWYFPDDAFLKALLLATVEGREDYRKFLARLHERYGLVVGVPEAEKAFGSVPVDEKAFSENALRLEHRLRALGLLKRLSDDCAYVVNPFGKRA